MNTMNASNEFDNIVFPKSPDDILNGDCEDFMKALENPTFWHKIPLLDHLPREKVANMQVVRFRGMLQDMVDNDICAKRVKVIRPNGSQYYMPCKYREWCTVENGIVVREVIDYDELEERQTFYVSTVPGANSWTAEYEKKHNMLLEPPVAADSDDEMDASEPKRLRRYSANGDAPPQVVVAAQPLPSDYFTSPIPDRPSMGCIVRVYGKDDTFTLNSLVDVVGFVWVDPPSLDDRPLDDDLMEFDENSYDSRHDGQGRVLPRLHALAIHKMPFFNPQLELRLGSNLSVIDQAADLASTFEETVTLLKLCLFNDELAATYTALHLISNVFLRQEGAAIGNLSLNLFNVPTAVMGTFPNKLYEILELILPASHLLPLTVDTLNTKKFSPSKDSASNCLKPGLLQLAQNTHLVLDATVLKEGILVSEGLRNLQSIQTLIRIQTIRAQFPCYEMDYLTDIPVLVISEQRDPLKLKCELLVPLEPEVGRVEIADESFKAARHYLNPMRLEKIRRFLTISKRLTIALEDGLDSSISRDYVSMRSMNNCSPQELHKLLVITRLLSISQGKIYSDMNSWQKAQLLHNHLTARLLKPK